MCWGDVLQILVCVGRFCWSFLCVGPGAHQLPALVCPLPCPLPTAPPSSLACQSVQTNIARSITTKMAEIQLRLGMPVSVGGGAGAPPRPKPKTQPLGKVASVSSDRKSHGGASGISSGSSGTFYASTMTPESVSLEREGSTDSVGSLDVADDEPQDMPGEISRLREAMMSINSQLARMQADDKKRSTRQSAPKPKGRTRHSASDSDSGFAADH